MVRLFSLTNQCSFIFTANALSCYRCGSLSPNVRKIQDCVGPYGIEDCSTDEACVVFKRLYKRGSGEKFHFQESNSSVEILKSLDNYDD